MKLVIIVVFLVLAVQVPSGSMDGTVTISGTNRPVANVHIQLGDKFNATTNEEGWFHLEGIPSGRYPVAIQRDGYVFAGLDTATAILSAHPDTGVPIPLGGITIGAGEHVRDFHFELKSATGVISGMVRDPAGIPMPNVSINLRQLSYDMGRKVISPIPWGARTDDRGSYRIFGLPPGEYMLFATLSEPAKKKQDQWRDTYYPKTLYADNAEPITLRDGEEIDHADITIQTGPAMRISGIVVPPSLSTTIVALAVTLLSQDVAGPAPKSLVFQSFKSPGEFTFDGTSLLPGRYDLSVQAIAPEGDYYGMVPISISGQPISGVQVILRSGVDLKGTTTFQEIPPGFTFQYPPVDLTSADSSCPACTRRSLSFMSQLMGGAPSLKSQTAKIDSSGAFTLPGIAEGQYWFVSGILPMGTFLEDVRQGDKSILDTGISISDQPPEPIHVIIGKGDATIEGRLLGENQQGLGLSQVVLVPDAEHRTNFNLYQMVTTDFRGRFTFGAFLPGSNTASGRSLLPGKYRIYAWNNIPKGAWTNPAYMKPYEDLGTAVTVKNGENLKDVVVNLISK